jgi:hypothetical protein
MNIKNGLKKTHLSKDSSDNIIGVENNEKDISFSDDYEDDDFDTNF